MVAEGARGGVGGAWRQDAEKWLNRGRAGRSRGVLAEPVALQSLEMAQRRHSQRQGQKALSTRRCIKTLPCSRRAGHGSPVRKHSAPEGALRPNAGLGRVSGDRVRKHSAPEGALRQSPPAFRARSRFSSESTQHQKVHSDRARSGIRHPSTRQKALSTRRCIKTWLSDASAWSTGVRKHSAPEGALRPMVRRVVYAPL